MFAAGIPFSLVLLSIQRYDICSCQSFQLCDTLTGECQCPSGWKGDACQFPLTANGPGLYSIFSSNLCLVYDLCLDKPERGDLYKKDK